MTVDLRDLLVHQADSALASTPDDAPADLWARGRRRRGRRRLAVGAATLATLAAIGGGAAGLTAYERGPAPPATSAVGHTDARSLGYPERITGIDDGDAAPGPVSGIAWAPHAPNEAEAAGQSDTYAVQPNGRLARLTTVGRQSSHQRISPDGRYLAYADGDGYHLLDLASGRAVPAPNLLNRWTPDSRAQLIWRSDSKAVYLPVTGAPPSDFALPQSGLVVSINGGLATIPTGNVTVAGFDGSDLVGVGHVSDRANLAILTTEIDPTDLVLRVWQDTGVTLESTGTRPGPEFVIGSASLSPDGTRLALRSVPSVPGNPTDVRVFDRATGHLLADIRTDQSVGVMFTSTQVVADPACPLTWRDNQLLVPKKGDRSFATSTTRFGISGDPVVIANPALDLTCIDWAQDALAGERHTAFYGVQDTWISWHPRTVLTLLGGTLGLVGWLAGQKWLRRRRPRDVLSV